MSSNLPHTEPANNGPLIIIGLAVVIAAAWVVWVVRQNPSQPEEPLSATPVVAAQTPEAPHVETAAEKCTGLWKTGQTKELIEALTQWLETSPSPAGEVTAWLLQLPEGQAREKLFATFGPKLPPAQRLELALTVQAPRRHRWLIIEALESWAEKDAKAALAWADQHTSDPAFPEARIALLTAWAVAQPRDSAAYVASQGDVAQRASTAVAVMKRWLKTDGSAAGSWVEMLPDEHLRATTTEALVQTWVATDEVSASDWVEQLPPSPLRDAAANTLARSLVTSDADAARTWAEQIADAKLREACLKALGEGGE